MLIVFEGLDRSGKTTQINLFKQKLFRDKERIFNFNFPNRSTDSGKILHNYLTFKIDLEPKAAHLLFAFNIWEAQSEIKFYLESGYTVILDRYFYSGSAYSIARGVSLDFCQQTFKGLLKPDIIFYMEIEPREASSRLGYGKERPENVMNQTRVKEAFKIFYKDFHVIKYEKDPHGPSWYILKTYKEKEKTRSVQFL